MFSVGYFNHVTRTVTDLKRPHHNFESAKQYALKMKNHPAFTNRKLYVIDYSQGRAYNVTDN